MGDSDQVTNGRLGSGDSGQAPGARCPARRCTPARAPPPATRDRGERGSAAGRFDCRTPGRGAAADRRRRRRRTWDTADNDAAEVWRGHMYHAHTETLAQQSELCFPIPPRPTPHSPQPLPWSALDKVCPSAAALVSTAGSQTRAQTRARAQTHARPQTLTRTETSKAPSV